MPNKRPYTSSEAYNKSEPSRKKARKGFAVGPEHLPDGTYRRRGLLSTKLSSSQTQSLTRLRSTKDKEQPDTQSKSQEKLCKDT